MTSTDVAPGAAALPTMDERKEPRHSNYAQRPVETATSIPFHSSGGVISGGNSTLLDRKRRASVSDESEPTVPLKVPRLPPKPSATYMPRRRHGKPPNPPPPYRLDFGQHRGKTLNQVPPSWLLWAIDKGIHKQHLDLGIALYEMGKTATLEHNGQILKAEPYSRRSLEQGPRQASNPEWVVPDKAEATGYPFWDKTLDLPAWIGNQDAINWFRVDPYEMERVGVCPLGEADIEHMSTGAENMWWLYEVYRYAEHFGTTKHLTAPQMLYHFLKHENARESEIIESIVPT